MNVLVTGAKGQLGHDTLHELLKRGYEAVGVDIEEMDITDGMAVAKVLRKTNPDAVIHCAAWTAVDPAEDEANRKSVYAVNMIGTENISRICNELNCKLLYISTDYVFDGQGTRPWEPDDVCHPLNVYGETKYKGEIVVEQWLEKYFIVRIAWVFGVNGNNFVKTMLALGKTRKHITVVDDQIGTPTYTYDLSRLLVDLVESEKYGQYHATNEGEYISWYDFAKEIFRQASKLNDDYNDVTVSPVGSEAFPSKAKRPRNSRMCKQKLIDNGFTLLPAWQDALCRYLKQIEV